MKNIKDILIVSSKHFKTICKHRSWVRYYASIAELPWWQAFGHDLSKFSYIEFSESVKYYSGDKSPIDNCKDINGYSLAWQHHKGRNPHHYEYWMDNFDTGATAIRMPYRYAVELLCDWLAAGQTYATNMNKRFSYAEELDYVISKFDNGCAMHPDDQKFIYLVLRNLKYLDYLPTIKDKCMKYVLKDKFFNTYILHELYDYSSKVTDDEFNKIRESVEHGFFEPNKKGAIEDV